MLFSLDFIWSWGMWKFLDVFEKGNVCVLVIHDDVMLFYWNNSSDERWAVDELVSLDFMRKISWIDRMFCCLIWMGGVVLFLNQRIEDWLGCRTMVSWIFNFIWTWHSSANAWLCGCILYFQQSIEQARLDLKLRMKFFFFSFVNSFFLDYVRYWLFLGWK